MSAMSMDERFTVFWPKKDRKVRMSVATEHMGRESVLMAIPDRNRPRFLAWAHSAKAGDEVSFAGFTIIREQP